MGTTGDLDVTVDTPGGRLSRFDVTLEQNGKTTPLFSLSAPSGGTLQQETAERVRLTRGLNKQDVPGLAAGAAKLVVRTARPVLFGLRTVTSEAARDLQVKLEPPRVGVVSTHHYINLGGSEMVVYRVSPAEAESGVGRRGTIGASRRRASIPTACRSPIRAIKVAFFALLYDQDLDARSLFARDEAGNQARCLSSTGLPQAGQAEPHSIDDPFLDRVVPAILEHQPDLDASGTRCRSSWSSTASCGASMPRRSPRSRNTAPESLWSGPFLHLTNTAVESSFADRRTYFYNGKEVDHQVHLGFDLASFQNAPVVRPTPARSSSRRNSASTATPW